MDFLDPLRALKAAKGYFGPKRGLLGPQAATKWFEIKLKYVTLTQGHHSMNIGTKSGALHLFYGWPKSYTWWVKWIIAPSAYLFVTAHLFRRWCSCWSNCWYICWMSRCFVYRARISVKIFWIIFTRHSTGPVPRHETFLRSFLLYLHHPTPTWTHVPVSCFQFSLERPKIASVSWSGQVSAAVLGQTFHIPDVVLWATFVIDVLFPDATWQRE